MQKNKSLPRRVQTVSLAIECYAYLYNIPLPDLAQEKCLEIDSMHSKHIEKRAMVSKKRAAEPKTTFPTTDNG